jgi:hypothetical protein
VVEEVRKKSSRESLRGLLYHCIVFLFYQIGISGGRRREWGERKYQKSEWMKKREEE